MQEIINRGERTKLTAFFRICVEEPDVAGVMLYKDIPKKYRWDDKHKRWVRYVRHVSSIGRLIHTSSRDPERFYLRLLLCHRRGPTSFEDLRTIDGIEYPTSKDAALAAGYLENDSEWEHCLTEAAQFKMPYQLRQLFAIILVYSLPSDVKGLWDMFLDVLSLDYQRQFGFGPEHLRVQYYTLKSLDTILRANGKTLEDFSNSLKQLGDFPAEIQGEAAMTLVERERTAYSEELLDSITANFHKLNAGQMEVFQTVVEAVNAPHPRQKLFFVDGPGGTGKSFLFEQIMRKLRQDRKIVLAVASSGIAATLLTGERTAHSMFKIPIKNHESSVCGISKQQQQGELIRQASLIIWDEAPMTSKSCFEVVDKLLRDFTDRDEPFGGKVVVFGGDFRQILPVVRGGGIAETVDACLKKSSLWESIMTLPLTENMRVKTAPNPASAMELAEFSEFLPSVGEGRYAVNEEEEIRLPDDMCIHVEPSQAQEDADFFYFSLLRIDNDDGENERAEDGDIEDDASKEERWINALVDAVYPRVGSEDLPDEYFAERAILAPTNRQVQRINDIVADRLPGETREYLSTDSVYGIYESLFETEYLNSLNFSGIPPHRIVLKVGAPIMMIRNINSHEGLCNGTRLRVVALKDNCIDAVIMVGPRKGQRVFIPRIIFISDDDDKNFPFQLRRKQFPVVPTFALTINKAQGQSIHHMGLYLRTPVFSHGQLYVALSRVTSRSAIKILVPDEDDDERDGVYTKNIIYRQIFYE